MAITFDYKILGQSKPAASVLTTAYTVSIDKATIISSIVVCNHHASTTDEFRIAIAQNGQIDNAKQYIYGGNLSGGLKLTKNQTFAAQLGITLAAGDEIRVWSLNGTSSFNIFGTERNG